MTMDLYNFIKVNLQIEEDIYHICIDIPNDAKVDNSRNTLQSSFTQINIMLDRNVT